MTPQDVADKARVEGVLVQAQFLARRCTCVAPQSRLNGTSGCMVGFRWVSRYLEADQERQGAAIPETWAERARHAEEWLMRARQRLDTRHHRTGSPSGRKCGPPRSAAA